MKNQTVILTGALTYSLGNLAKADGVSDDGPLIQSVLDELSADDGHSRLHIPSGSYFIGYAPLYISPNTTVSGDGDSTLLISRSPTAALCNKNSSQAVYDPNIVIRDLCLDLEERGNNGIYFGGVKNGSVLNVGVRDPRGYGIWIARAGETPTSEGVGSRNVLLQGCRVSGVTDVGIELYGASLVSVIGNSVSGRSKGDDTDNPARGLYAWNGATDCVFIGNMVEGEGNPNNFMAIDVLPAEIDKVKVSNPTQTKRIKFIGNVCSNVSRGFRIIGWKENYPRDITVCDNSFSGQPAPHRNGYASEVRGCRCDSHGNYWENLKSHFRS